ncbi:MAG: hypothetical protein J5940_04045 [Clostridia bacterium]|nr:hypothetical protein [Clostridia bacterium]
MKRSSRLLAMALVVIMAFAAMSVFAEGEFIQSVTAYTADAVARQASASGNPEEDVVADLVDQDGKAIEGIQRKDLAVVNPSEGETAENKEALKGINEAVKEVEKSGVAGILDSEAKKALKEGGFKADALAVATVFDISLEKAIPEGATLQFAVKISAISSLKSSDTYTGKVVILQENTETGKFEALKEGKKGELKAGEFAIDGDIAEIAVSHLCVFMVAAETVETAPAKTTSSWWIWLLIAIAIILVIVIVFVILKKKDKKEDKKEDKKA